MYFAGFIIRIQSTEFFPFGDITQRKVVIPTEVSEQPIGPAFNNQKSKTFGDRTDRLSRNVGKELPLYAP